jgi:hypothetical protein
MEERNGNSHQAIMPAVNGEAVDEGNIFDLLDGDEDLREEMERLVEEQRQLLQAAGRESAPLRSEPAANAVVHDDLEPLQAENALLRARIETLEQQLASSEQERQGAWADQQKEFEALLEEKSEVIRSLHLTIQELRQNGDKAAAGESASDGAAEATAHNPAAFRKQLERERAQLREDEEALEQQMKQMEMTMSRERVEIARQRTELQRLQSDLKHELEQAARDAGLRERLAPLQRRHQEIVNSRGAGTSPQARPATMTQLSRPATTPQLQPAPAAPTPPPRKANSGLLRRLFGGSK